MGSGRAAAARTRSRRSTTRCSGKTAKRVWVLDADLAAAFDRIDHDQLLGATRVVPRRGMIRGWLKAGVFENGKGFAPTEEGTPQGGRDQPVLLNVALHGMEEAAGVRYLTRRRGCREVSSRAPGLIRYADDLVALCHTREQAEQVKAQLAEWLAPRGWPSTRTRRASSTSTRVRLPGVQRPPLPNGKLLIKPSKAAIRRIRERLAAEVRALRGDNAEAVIARLNPIIRGWAAYYRDVVSSKVFNALDTYVWKLTYKWAHTDTRNKPKRWIVDHYFGAFNTSRSDRWVFGDRDSGAYLHKFAWTTIVRHQLVKGGASPDDPALTDYWAKRRGRNQAPTGTVHAAAAPSQHGRCPLCGDYLLYADHQPAVPHRMGTMADQPPAKRSPKRRSHHAGQATDDHKPRLVHAHCQRRHNTPTATAPPSINPPASPRGLLEPCAATSRTHGS